MKTIAIFLSLTMSCGYLNAQSVSWTVYDTATTTLGSMISDIEFDSNGVPWVCTGSLYEFDGINWIKYSLGVAADHFASDGAGNKWVAVFTGLRKFDGTNFTKMNDDNVKRVVAVDANNNVWYAKSVSGLVKWKDTLVANYRTFNSGLPDDDVYDIDFDSSGNRWICTFGGGLAKFHSDDSTWTVYNTSNSGIAGNSVYQLAFGPDSVLWLATSFGLSKFDDTTWTNYRTNNSDIPGNQCYSVAVEENGTVWVGTSSWGVGRFDGSNWTVYDYTNSPFEYTGSLTATESIVAIAVAPDGKKWFGTDKYLFVLDENGGTPVWEKIPATMRNAKVYPNPVSTAAVIKINNSGVANGKKLQLIIFDVSGKELKTVENVQVNADSEIQIERGNLESGAYFYSVSHNGEIIGTGKMVVE